MKILEQILKEIRPDYEVPFFETEAEGRAYMQGKAAQANEDRRIIRSHMEDDGWIPVEELLPEKPIPVWVTRKMCTGYYVSVDTYHTRKWKYYDDGTVIAWMPKDKYLIS